METQPNRIVLFDGVCNVCDQAVLFIIDRDRRGRFSFASLQSRAAQRLLGPNGPTDLSTIVLIENGRVYTRSTAALRIARHLDGAWPLLSLLRLIPRPIRDLAYGYFAAHRYKWFGQLDACRIPTPDLRRRFLEMGGAEPAAQA